MKVKIETSEITRKEMEFESPIYSFVDKGDITDGGYRMYAKITDKIIRTITVKFNSVKIESRRHYGFIPSSLVRNLCSEEVWLQQVNNLKRVADDLLADKI